MEKSSERNRDPFIVGDDLGERIKSVAGDEDQFTVAIDKSAFVDTENNLPTGATKVGEDVLCVEGEKDDSIETSGEKKSQNSPSRINIQSFLKNISGIILYRGRGQHC